MTPAAVGQYPPNPSLEHSEHAESVDVPTLVITLNGKAVANLPITQQRTRIGRRPGNDIVLESPSISGEHAVLVDEGGQLTIEDLGSTNGTFVGGARITRQELGPADLVRLGEYTLAIGTETPDAAATAYEPTLGSNPLARGACLQVLGGPRDGELFELRKVVTTLGKPGVCVVTCIRRGDDYAVRFTDGPGAAKLNGAVLQDAPVRLSTGDVLELADTRLQFLIRTA